MLIVLFEGDNKFKFVGIIVSFVKLPEMKTFSLSQS